VIITYSVQTEHNHTIIRLVETDCIDTKEHLFIAYLQEINIQAHTCIQYVA